ncbi:MAG: nucleotidyl transferase AbiEii/AbiGii toxin family protein [Armatimonadetes bacterium]|nr:nucleotidyl transferase AbiEii/AbiGii toxin family protein [Armatimonadota bacterium]
MQENYYQKTLYPIQDNILTIISKLPVDFYLTGGIALSRCYLDHRYSDDLVFFVNNAKNFKEQVEVILDELTGRKIKYEIVTISKSFVRLQVEDQKNSLKIDFINDINIHFGCIEICSIFPRVDNSLNILSNKICAISRYEPKDIADIIFISESYAFSWEKILNEANQKDIWVNPIEISRIIYEFPAEKLSLIKWIKPVNIEKIQKYIKIVAKDILNGENNSLNKEKNESNSNCQFEKGKRQKSKD